MIDFFVDVMKLTVGSWLLHFIFTLFVLAAVAVFLIYRWWRKI